MPFLGFIEDRSHFRPGLVTPWVDAGSLRKYLDSDFNIDIDVHSLVRYQSSLYTARADISQILGIARGLEYLHSKKIVHGDLKPVSTRCDWLLLVYIIDLHRCQENILIATGPKPVLMDFGLSHLQSSTSTFESATDGSFGTICYMAIELLTAEDEAKLEHTTHSDVWAFGMISQVSHYPELTFPEHL